VPTQSVELLFGKSGLRLRVPASAVVLESKGAPAIADPGSAVPAALEKPIGTPALSQLLRQRRPKTVAITISDITRPVPNQLFLPPMLAVLNECGIRDSQVCIIIGAGMHRPSRPEERLLLLGQELLDRLEVIDHQADQPQGLVKVSDDPPVSVSRRFAQADFRIVTGYIEPHFMAGYSGGRKGVCPALVDLASVQRFHGYATLADPRADTGVLAGNPCHEIALAVARTVGVDFLFNVALSRDRRIAGIYCGDLEQAHAAGCADVAVWTSAEVPPAQPTRPQGASPQFDLVITNGGGFPLDQTFYQSVKGMCGALPILGNGSTLLIVSHCGEGLGSGAFGSLLGRWGDDWRGFLAHIAASGTTELDQWELQMQSRVLDRIGQERLWFVSDGIAPETQRHIGVTPILGPGQPQQRAQRAVDEFLAARSDAAIAVIPEGPYTMLKNVPGAFSVKEQPCSSA
jgi:nickel-dependent lactate racemase